MAKFEHDLLLKLQGKRHAERVERMEKQLQEVAQHLRSIRQMKVERDYYEKQYNQAMAHMDQMREEMKEYVSQRQQM